MAVDEINNHPDFDFSFTAHVRDPRGVITEYHTVCDDLIRNTGSSTLSAATRRRRASRCCRSSSAPIACSGTPPVTRDLECSDNVIYVGASPNHNVLPLVRYMLDNISRHVFCVGSNYVWTWETNRVTRELVTAAHGSILAERLLELGEKRGRPHRRRDRSPQASGRLQHAGRQFELRFHPRVSCRHHGRRSRHSDAELQPLRAGTQDRWTGICRMHHLVSLFREHPPAREPCLRPALEGALR